MILTNRKNCLSYLGISNELDMAPRYIAAGSDIHKDPGRYKLKGDDAWIRISDNTTKPREQAHAEAHDRYLDIQLVADGKETIACGFREKMKQLCEDKERDVSYWSGEMQDILLCRDELLILFPEDVHTPSIAPREPGHVRKVLVKVRA